VPFVDRTETQWPPDGWLRNALAPSRTHGAGEGAGVERRGSIVLVGGAEFWQSFAGSKSGRSCGFSGACGVRDQGEVGTTPVPARACHLIPARLRYRHPSPAILHFGKAHWQLLFLTHLDSKKQRLRTSYQCRRTVFSPSFLASPLAISGSESPVAQTSCLVPCPPCSITTMERGFATVACVVVSHDSAQSLSLFPRTNGRPHRSLECNRTWQMVENSPFRNLHPQSGSQHRLGILVSAPVESWTAGLGNRLSAAPFTTGYGRWQNGRAPFVPRRPGRPRKNPQAGALSRTRSFRANSVMRAVCEGQGKANRAQEPQSPMPKPPPRRLRSLSPWLSSLAVPSVPRFSQRRQALSPGGSRIKTVWDSMSLAEYQPKFRLS